MSIRRNACLPTRRQLGLTLIELIVFIVIISVGLAGLLSVFNLTVTHSADPMIRKQMLSIAEALLEEVELQPFTYCDPTDPNWANATATGTCTIAEGLGATAEQWSAGGPPYGDQTRTSATAPFNNVNDYNGLTLNSPIADINGTAAAPAGYSANIVVDAGSVGTPLDLNGISSDGTAANMRAVRIAVTVCRNATWPCPVGADSLTLEGYRTRYWPNDLPW